MSQATVERRARAASPTARSSRSRTRRRSRRSTFKRLRRRDQLARRHAQWLGVPDRDAAGDAGPRPRRRRASPQTDARRRAAGAQRPECPRRHVRAPRATRSSRLQAYADASSSTSTGSADAARASRAPGRRAVRHHASTRAYGALEPAGARRVPADRAARAAVSGRATAQQRSVPGRVTVVGLGPAGADHLLPGRARRARVGAPCASCAPRRHPAVAELAAEGMTFDVVRRRLRRRARPRDGVRAHRRHARRRRGGSGRVSCTRCRAAPRSPSAPSRCCATRRARRRRRRARALVRRARVGARSASTRWRGEARVVDARAIDDRRARRSAAHRAVRQPARALRREAHAARAPRPRHAGHRAAAARPARRARRATVALAELDRDGRARSPHVAVRRRRRGGRGRARWCGCSSSPSGCATRAAARGTPSRRTIR